MASLCFAALACTTAELLAGKLAEHLLGQNACCYIISLKATPHKGHASQSTTANDKLFLNTIHAWLC